MAAAATSDAGAAAGASTFPEEDLLTEAASLTAYLKKKEEDVKATVTDFEKSVKRVQDESNLCWREMEMKLEKLRAQSIQHLQRTRTDRSRELDAIARELMKLRIELGDMLTVSPSKRAKTRAALAARMEQIKTIRVRADLLFDTEADSPAFTTLKLAPMDGLSDFMRRDFTWYYCLRSTMTAWDFSLRMLPQDSSLSSVCMEVSTVPREELEEEEGRAVECKKIPQILLKEFAIFLDLDGEERQRFSIPDLFQCGSMMEVEEDRFKFKLDLGEERALRDVMVHVRFSGHDIMKSPQMVSVRPNKSFRMDTLPKVLRNTMGVIPEEEDTGAKAITVDMWSSLGGETAANGVSSAAGSNLTRTGKAPAGDLDESDARAMGYGETTSIPDPAVGGGEPRRKLSIVPEESEGECRADSDDGLMTAAPRPRADLGLGPQGSPLVSRTSSAAPGEGGGGRHPLEIQSPLTPIACSRYPADRGPGGDGAAADPPPTKSGFTPTHASTETNLGECLTRISVPQTSQNGPAGDLNRSMFDRAPGTDIERFQRDLSGEDAHNEGGGGGGGGHNDTKANKSVSFHPETTIYQTLANCRAEARQEEAAAVSANNLTVMNAINGGGGASNVTLVQILTEEREKKRKGVEYTTSVGQTKTGDGAQELHKNLLEQQQGADVTSTTMPLLSSGSVSDAGGRPSPSSEDHCWKMSEDSWRQHLERRSAELAAAYPRQTETTTTNWDDPEDVAAAKAAKEPEFDLSDNDVTLCLIRAFPIDGLPQGVARDSEADVTYVTDVENNKVIHFKGWNKIGLFSPKTTFFSPRYVHCLNDGRVLVLDNKALYVIHRASGTVMAKLFEGVADRCRGLAYYREFGRVVTVSVDREDGDVARIWFVDIDVQRGVVDSITLEETRGKAASKVRFVTCEGGKVYCTDLGLGQLYVTDLKTRKTETVRVPSASGGNRLKNAMGVALDPAGNVLVASQHRGKIELLSRDSGEYVRSLNTPKLVSPTGVLLQDYFLYVVDSASKMLLQYSVAKL